MLEHVLQSAASESALKNTAAPVTETGPLGGFATTTPEAAQLDFLLTQWQMEIEGAAEVDTAEEAVHHDAEALKIKREIIERYTPRSAKEQTDKQPASVTWELNDRRSTDKAREEDRLRAVERRRPQHESP
jgi:hypothetical protein